MQNSLDLTVQSYARLDHHWRETPTMDAVVKMGVVGLMGLMGRMGFMEKSIIPLKPIRLILPISPINPILTQSKAGERRHYPQWWFHKRFEG